MISLLPIALFAAAALTVGVAVRVCRHPGVGSRQFLWLMAAIALWCATAGAQAMADTLAAKLVWAKLRYVGVATVAPLWLVFTAAYVGVPWFDPSTPRGRFVRAAFWVVPAATILIAASNESHGALWSDVTLSESGRIVFTHGWWFWLFVAHSYVLTGIGTILVARDLRRSPPALRGQFIALIPAAIVPLFGNIVYLTITRTRGFDPTPLAFVASSLLFAWALYRNHLFDLLPVARGAVIDSLSDGVIVLDPSRRILDLNAAARELIRRHGAWLGDKEWVGQSVDVALPILAATPLASTHGQSDVIATAGEQPCSFDMRVVPVRWRADRTGACWVVLLRDITEQRRAAAERDALHERMQDQQRRESLSILAAGLAHDFNNLLTGIVGNADLLAMKVPASSSMGDNVGAILLGAQRAADLVAKMLAYAGERHGSTSRIDLDELTRDLLDLLRASAARHCTLIYSGSSAIIDGDPTQVRQVAMNLIINAAEAVSDAGTVTITVGTQRLTAAELSRMRVGQDAPPGDYAFLNVRDNGAGMDAATQRRLFQPFFTTKATGHGLGLAAVQGIVIGHRGALRVDSGPGRGARFCVWFPLAPRQESGVRNQVSGLVREEGFSRQESVRKTRRGLIPYP